MRKRVECCLAFSFVVLLAPINTLSAQPATATGNPAESLRRFLLAQGALSPPNWWLFAEDLTKLYAVRSIEKPPGCPLTSFRDQPSVASSTSLNIFVVDFKEPADTVCRQAPHPGLCAAVRENCVAIGTSVFCDYSYLKRLETVGALAYYAAWLGLRQVREGGKAMFIPLQQPALLDLARLTLAAQRRTAGTPPGLKIVPEAERLAQVADSALHALATSVSLLTPVLHEVAHIEQSFCGRPIGKEGGDDFVARLMFTGDHDYAETARLYEQLTCSTLSRNELDADLRSIDMFYRYLENEAPAAASNPQFRFAPQVDTATRSSLPPIARFSREVALLAIMYTLEYQLLVHHDPLWAWKTVEAEPAGGASLQPFTAYYVSAANQDAIPRVRNHVEPAFRAVTIAKTLGLDRLEVANRGHAVALSHLRVAPFAIGRFVRMTEHCRKAHANTQYLDVLSEYVLDAFTGSLKYPPAGRGDASRAARLVARLTTSPTLARTLRPTLEDYRTIFIQPFADKAYRYYEPLWAGSELSITANPGATEVLVYPMSTDDVRRDGGARHLPGGYSDIAKMLRPGLFIYSWNYVRPGAHFGQSYDGLYFVNERWVFVPKPHRVK